MGWALAAVGCAALFSGTALVLQASAARKGGGADRLHASLVVRLLRERTYLLAMLLTLGGFGLAFAALRVLPVFVVQAGRASSLAVAAVLSTRLHGSRIRPLEWGGIGVTLAGLVLLASSTAAAQAGGSPVATVVLGCSAVALAVIGTWAAAARSSRRVGLLLAVLAGCGFSLLAAGVHTLVDLHPMALVASPAAWAAMAGGGLGLLLTALAFQRAPVVAVSAIVTGTETVGGAVLGIMLTSDHAAAGRGPLALGGFVLVLAGSLVVARYGAPEEPARSASLEGPTASSV